LKRSSKEGYTGGFSILTDYVRDRRRGLAASSKPAYVPLKFELGEAFQFDWSDEWLTVGGIHRKIQAAHTKRCARRAFFLSAHPTQAHEMLYDAHARAFTALGGVPRRGIYGNMKTAVDKVVKRTNGRVDIHAGNALVARHQRLPGRGQAGYDWQHYIPLIGKKPGALRNGAPFADMPPPLAQLQAALRRRERQQGDRAMAKVLAAVPAHGLEAVLRAVKQMLDAGVTSIEQVANLRTPDVLDFTIIPHCKLLMLRTGIDKGIKCRC